MGPNSKLFLGAVVATALVGGAIMQSNQQALKVSETAAAPEAVAEVPDEFLWLEEVEGERAIAWAKERNADAEAKLKGDPRFETLRASAEAVLTAVDRIPYASLDGETVENFWQDRTAVRGIWRRASLDSYRTASPAWETVLDLDALAKAEGKNWVYKGHDCLAPASTRCLVSLSDGGKDAVVVREFDTASKSWVADGFQLPEAKSWVSWADKDTLLVATDYGAGTLTESGYARQVRLWPRGTDLAAARIVMEVDVKDVWARPAAIHRPEGTTLLLQRGPDFFTEEWRVLKPDGAVVTLPLPLEVDLKGILAGRLLVQLRGDWTINGASHMKGSLLGIDLAGLIAGSVTRVESLFTPTATVALDGVSVSQTQVLLSVLDNVTGRVVSMTPTEAGWTTAEVALPANGSTRIVSTDAWSDAALINFASFLQPDTLYLRNGAGAPEAIKSLPARFDASPFTTEQRFATSKDGTKVPYFVIRRADLKNDGSNPTVLFGYGGFEISLTPSYLTTIAKDWLLDGGVYAIANIRGGGEYGPSWHQSALKGNRQRAFDDFAAVAEDMIASGMTKPQHLGIRGGSNGGLLTGTALTQRPELFNAAIIAVPLLDMLRYHLLPAGASWMGEYGDPRIAEDRASIARYSPYQNLQAGKSYPLPFVYTSTKDDRVHPGHARKFVARMMAQNHPVVYFENIEGGHSAAANLKQRAEMDALQGVYLRQRLMDKP